MDGLKFDNPVSIHMGSVDDSKSYILVDSCEHPLQSMMVEGQHYGFSVCDRFEHNIEYPTQNEIVNIVVNSGAILEIYEKDKSLPWVFHRGGVLDLPARFDLSNDDSLSIEEMSRINENMKKYLRKRIGLE